MASSCSSVAQARAQAQACRPIGAPADHVSVARLVHGQQQQRGQYVRLRLGGAHVGVAVGGAHVQLPVLELIMGLRAGGRLQ